MDLGPRVVVVQVGRIPQADDDPRGSILSEAIGALGRHGDRVGATLALETGLEAGKVLRAFLDRFDTGGLGVNQDPANLLIGGFDPYESARALHGRVVHSHAKDARQATANRAGQEVPLGHGDMDWQRYLSVLEEIGYRGWLVVEREGGDQRIADIEAGVAVLRQLVR
jgi:L-ribulose-5-phosphate 3-epimerase